MHALEVAKGALDPMLSRATRMQKLWWVKGGEGGGARHYRQQAPTGQGLTPWTGSCCGRALCL